MVMKRVIIIASFVLGFLVAPAQAGALNNANLVLWWTPVIYQQDDGLNPMARENVFTAVNYDKDWRANNNWDNLPYYPPSPSVYYSLVESDTHYFIGYYLYYPRHTSGSKHEHDMIGALVVVKKGSDNFGQLELLLTYSNDEWHKRSSSHVCCESNHPILKISTGTHEIANERAQVGGAYPLPLPGSTIGTIRERGGYQLLDLQELWQHRNDIGQNRTFNRWGYFDSNSRLNTSAPWVWEYRRINWLARPAELVQHIQGNGNKPVTYISNPYIGAQ